MVHSEGFEVNDSVEIENIDDVKRTKNVIPASSNVLLEISKVTGETSKDKLGKTVNVSFKLVDGIEVEGEVKYKGALATSFPQRFTYWNSPEKVAEKIAGAKKETTRNWWKNKQYLVEFKELLVSLGLKAADFTLDGKLQVDSLISALKGQRVMGNIVQKEEQAFDKSTGEYKGLGSFQNEVKNLRKVS